MKYIEFISKTVFRRRARQNYDSGKFGLYSNFTSTFAIPLVCTLD